MSPRPHGHAHASPTGTTLLLRYVLAVASSAVVLVTSRALEGPLEGVLFAVPTAAAALITIALGAGPGLLAAVLMGIGIGLFFEPLRGSSVPASGGELARLAAYFVASLTVVIAIDLLGRTRRRLAVAKAQLERALAEQRADAERSRTLADNSPEVIARFDRELRHIYVNEYGAKVYGVPVREVIGKSNAELGMPDDKVAFWKERFQEVIDSGQEQTVDFEFDSPTFGHRYFSSLFVPERDERGELASILAITRDITELKRTERSLRDERDFIAAVLDSAASVVLVIAPDGRIHRCNGACERATGYTASELSELRYSALVPPDELDGVSRVWQELLRGGGPSRHENYWRAKDGTLRLFAWSNTVMRDGAGCLRFVVSTGIDITERAKAEAEARRAAEILEFGDAYIEVDRNYRVVRVNAQQERISHTPRSESVGRVLWDVWPETADPASKLWREYHRCMTERVPVKLEEYSASLDLWSSINAYPTSSGGIALFIRDVTHRRRAEEALRRSEEQRGLALRAAELGTWDFDLRSGEVYWDERFRTIYGVSADRMRYEDFLTALVHPEDRARLRAVVEQTLEPAPPGMARSMAIDYRVVRSDGASRWVQVKGEAFFAGDGPARRAVRFVGTVADITDRRIAEDELRRREEQFRYLADSMPQLVWTTSPDGVSEYYNRRWYEYTGMRPDDARGEAWSQLIHPEDQERTLERWQQSLTGGEPYQVEYRLRGSSDGVYRWFLGRATPVRDAEGRILRWFGTCTDIEDQKRIEAELQQEKQRLGVILASLPVGVFIADARGRIVEINERGRDIWGGVRSVEAPSEYVEYKGYWPESGRRLSGEEWALARAVLYGETVTGEIVDIDRFGGTRGRILNNAAPFRDQDGRISGAVVVVHDITDLKLAEDALRESEQKYRALFDHMAMGFAYCRVMFEGELPVDYVYEEINRAYEEQTGLRREDVVGRRLTQLSAAEDVRASVETLGEVARTGNPVRDERYVASLGKWFDVHAYCPKPGHFAILLLDVTERRETQAALKAANERLMEADRRKNEFLAMLSHELRNPLAPIRNSLYILERAQPGGRQAQRAHDVIGRQVTHLTKLIDDLLDVMRISRGKIRLQREPVELCGLVRRTIEDHRSIFAAARVEFEIGACDYPVHADADPTRLSQVVGNLLSNAAKFTPPGGRVSLSLQAQEPRVAVLEVRDNGAGIAPELLEKLFEPFVQADATLDRSKGGLGLGLALVKGLVELHGGTVSARSDGPGKGAVFTLRIPVERPKAPRPAIAPPRLESETRALRVLLIEDNADAAASLKEALELNGHEVETAATGFEGINTARAFRPDVIVCDIGLPGIDGFEVARRMRADPELRDAPLVALSGYAAPDDIERSREVGFVRHLAKPPDLGQLERTLSDVTPR